MSKRPHQEDPELLPFWLPFFWPLAATAAASEIAKRLLAGTTTNTAKIQTKTYRSDEQWATPNQVILDLPTMRLRCFSTQGYGTPTLLCAPYAMHGATIADFAPRHSLVEGLRGSGLSRVCVTDWRSATPEMRYFSIDTYLAELNVAIDELGPPVNLIGLCQGGWMALLYAARFPEKVRRLCLAGAPVDIGAARSYISGTAENTPIAVFEELVSLGGGRVLGDRVLQYWTPVLATDQIDRILQIDLDGENGNLRELESRFAEWNATTVDLPGTYFLEVVRLLFKDNAIARGRFVALGRQIDLKNVRCPLYLLAARDDELVAVEQLLATARIVGTPRTAIQTATEPCSHLALFLGQKTLSRGWGRIGRWLQEDDATLALAS